MCGIPEHLPGAACLASQVHDFGNSLGEMYLCPEVAEKILVFNLLVIKVNMRWSGSVHV